jgi:hypothetical protein
VRDKSGVCIRCLPGEAGEFVGKIVKGEVKTVYGLKCRRNKKPQRNFGAVKLPYLKKTNGRYLLQCG